MSQSHWRERLRGYRPVRTLRFGRPGGQLMAVDEFMLPLSALGSSNPGWAVLWVRSGHALIPQTTFQVGAVTAKLCHPVVHAPFRQHSLLSLVLARRAVMRSFMLYYNLGDV